MSSIAPAIGARRLHAGRSRGVVVVTAAVAGILAIAYLAHAGEPARIENLVKIRSAKLKETKRFLAEHYELLAAPKEDQGQKQNVLQTEPLLTIIKVCAESVGLTERLSSIVPQENMKLGEITAKVVFRRVRLADVVNFLAYVRSNSADISDREAQLRLARRQQEDMWDAYVSLTGKKQ
jgi:hypothetical protein